MEREYRSLIHTFLEDEPLDLIFLRPFIFDDVTRMHVEFVVNVEEGIAHRSNKDMRGRKPTEYFLRSLGGRTLVMRLGDGILACLAIMSSRFWEDIVERDGSLYSEKNWLWVVSPSSLGETLPTKS
mmetsp:Transcript_10698/g.16144  ORF Transcript_10698/g.16144 Transcript_10698/m.16144 type:complete len:126 (+) Transcript_10698:337-714(+)